MLTNFQPLNSEHVLHLSPDNYIEQNRRMTGIIHDIGTANMLFHYEIVQPELHDKSAVHV